MTDCPTVDFSPAELNIIGFKSGTLAYLLKLEKSLDEGVTWTALDLTGYTNIEVVIFDRGDPTVEVESFTEGNGKLSVDSPAGLVQIQVDQAEVEAYEWMSEHYFFRVTDPTGVTAALTGGSFRLTWEPVSEVGQGAC